MLVHALSKAQSLGSTFGEIEDVFLRSGRNGLAELGNLCVANGEVVGLLHVPYRTWITTLDSYPKGGKHLLLNLGARHTGPGILRVRGDAFLEVAVRVRKIC